MDGWKRNGRTRAGSIPTPGNRKTVLFCHFFQWNREKRIDFLLKNRFPINSDSQIFGVQPNTRRNGARCGFGRGRKKGARLHMRSWGRKKERKKGRKGRPTANKKCRRSPPQTENNHASRERKLFWREFKAGSTRGLLYKMFRLNGLSVYYRE